MTKGPFQLITCPGAWTPAEHWQSFTQALAHAPADLAGSAVAQWPQHAEAGLQAHRDAVLDAVPSTDETLVLAGHSFGAFPMLEAAAVLGEQVAGLIFIDAFLPEHGRSIFAQSEGRSGPRIMREQAEQAGGLVPPPDPAIWGLPVRSDDDPLPPLRPQALCCFEDELTPAALAVLDQVEMRAYLAASKNGNNPFRRAFEGLQGRKDWFSVEIDGGHLLHVERPAALAYWSAQFLRMVAGRTF